MDEASPGAIQTLALVLTLWLTGIGVGMMVQLSEIVRSLTRLGLVARTVTLDVLVVPVAMWIAVRLLVEDEGYATGLLLVAFAAAGPLGLKLAQVARADTAFAIGIVVVLEAANILLIPLWSGLLGLTSSADVFLEIVRTVTLLVALPLAIGLAVQHVRPERAAAVSARALRLATVGLVVVVSIIVTRSLDTMLETFTNGAALASGIVITFALGAGWLVGGPQESTRLATSLVSGCRASGAALAVASSAFADRPEVAAGVVTAGLVSVLIPTLVAYLIAWRIP
jgi:BASS family bile acid:Na+ symporter